MPAAEHRLIRRPSDGSITPTARVPLRHRHPALRQPETPRRGDLPRQRTGIRPMTRFRHGNISAVSVSGPHEIACPSWTIPLSSTSPTPCPPTTTTSHLTRSWTPPSRPSPSPTNATPSARPDRRPRASRDRPRRTGPGFAVADHPRLRDGGTNREIAGHLGVGRQTVKSFNPKLLGL